MTPPAMPVDLTATLLRVLGVSIILIGAFLAGLEHSTPATAAARQTWSRRMRGLMDADWGGAAGRPVLAFVGAVETVVGYMLLRADRGSGLGALALMGVLFVIPAAAVINALTGGSPFLAGYYGVLVVAIVVLVVSGEIRSLSWLHALLSTAVLISLFLIIPVYLIYSFIDLSRYPLGGNIMVTALFVVPFWCLGALFVSYVVDQMLFRLRAGGDDEQVGLHHRILAMAPLAFVLFHFMLAVGQALTGEEMTGWPWRLVLICTGAGAVTAGGGLWLVRWAARCHRPAAVAQAAGLVLIAGVVAGALVLVMSGAASAGDAISLMWGQGREGTPPLSWPFWVAQGVALPGYAFVMLPIIGMATRAAAVVLDGVRRPYLVMGGSAAVLGSMVWTSGWMLSP